MKKLIVLISTLILCGSIFAQTEDWLWARQPGGTSNGRGQAIATDTNGNSYVTGSFVGTAIFGNTTLNSIGSYDIFIAKLDTYGNFLWAKKAGGTSSDSGYGISIDNSGNSYVIGCFEGTANFGSTTLTSSGSRDIFIAKLDTYGNFLLAKKAGGTSSDDGYGIAVDSSGNSYVTGSFLGTANFGGISLVNSSTSDTDFFIAKLDSSGNFLWAKKALISYGTSNDIGRGIATDSNGNCYVTGVFEDSAYFDSIYLFSSGNKDVFITKLDSSGNFLWAKKAGGTSNDEGYSISTDNSGNVCITGYFRGTASFGSNSLVSSGTSYYDIFISKLDTSGNFLWVKKAGGTNNDYGSGIVTDNSGNSYITGRFVGNASFGSTTLTSSGFEDIFIAKLDSSGNYLWAKKAGGTGGNDSGYDLATDSIGNCYVTGYFSGTASFGGNTLTISGGTETFISKIGTIHELMSPNGGEIWQSGSTKLVYWNFINAGGEVNIYLSINGGNWIMMNSSPILATLGRFAFTLPYIASNECLVKVESTINNTWYDISDAVFAISSSSPASIMLTAPNNAKLQAGKSYAINWLANGVANVNLEYSIDAGVIWNIINTSLPASLGTYNWTVPSTPAPYCYLRISDAASPTVYDWSDDPFTISSMLLSSPNGNEIWGTGSQHAITWSTASVSNVKLEFSIDDGSSWTQIVSSVSASSGTYDWAIPAVNSALCKVRISDTAAANVYDTSDMAFSIRPQITLISPNGSEYLTVNSIYSILWSNTADVSSVLLDYSIDNGISWLPIQASAYPASVGRYDWFVPNNPSANCLVKVRSSDDNAIYDVSEVVFTISLLVQPMIQIRENSISFGIVYLGSSSAIQELWIRNTGTADLEVSNLSFWQTQTRFEVMGATLPISIALGDSVALQLGFTPLIAGAVTDSLYMHNNSQNIPIAAIRLSGTGEYVPPKPPDNVSIIMNGYDAIISWDAVTETIFDTPITPDCYLLFFNGSSNIDDDYYFLGVTTGLNYTHYSVGRYSPWMFYRVLAYKDFTGNRGDAVLNRLSRNLTETEVTGILRTK